MRCKWNRFPVAAIFSLWIICGCLIPSRAYAATVQTNEATGYVAVIDDEADLLTESEEAQLIEVMMDVTAYGNAVFHSVLSHSDNYSVYAEEYYHHALGTASGTALVIDMQERTLTIYSDGDIYKVVTPTRADTITDNIFRKAGRGDYEGCAEDAFRQVVTLMQGDEIAKPMKYVSNALLALLLALLINFLRIRRASRLKAAELDAILETASVDLAYSSPQAIFTHESRTYSPVAKSTGGGGGGGRSGGGGGHSGGGGSHRF